jgi:hypothetical protein
LGTCYTAPLQKHEAPRDPGRRAADEVKLEKSVTANMHIPQIHAADRFAIQYD